MGHNRKLVLSGVALTKARNNKHGIPVMTEIRDELEQIVIENKLFEDAPFKWVGLTLRYGLKDDEIPTYFKIDKKDGELPVAIELDIHGLRTATRDELKQYFMRATLRSLIHIGIKFSLPINEFEELLEKYS